MLCLSSIKFIALQVVSRKKSGRFEFTDVLPGNIIGTLKYNRLHLFLMSTCLLTFYWKLTVHVDALCVV